MSVVSFPHPKRLSKLQEHNYRINSQKPTAQQQKTIPDDVYMGCQLACSYHFLLIYHVEDMVS